MNQPTHEIEKLLSQGLVDAPANLKGDVESAIEESLRIQTRRDDLKWLATSFGILLLTIGFCFALLMNANRQSRALSNRTLTKTEDGHRIARLLLSRNDRQNSDDFQKPQTEL